MKTYDVDMRDAFFDELYAIAKNDSQVVLLTADMGAYSLNKFKRDLSNQYINVGIAEQNMVSIAAGLALGGKKAFIYTIIPFISLRCYEQIKVDLCCMNLPVAIIGVGPGLTYGSDGPTHHATQDIAVMRILPEITILNHSDAIMTSICAKIAYKNKGPTYVRIDKGKFPSIYDGRKKDNFLNGLRVLKEGLDLTIVSTGVMVHRALNVAEELEGRSLSAGVVDLYRIKPLNEEMLLRVIGNSKYIITLEENTVVGGLGSIICEMLSDNKINIPVKRIAIPDEHCFETGNREGLHKFYNLDTNGITRTILGCFK